MNTITSIIIGVAVLILILYRQLREQPIKEERTTRLPLILGVVGLFEIVAAISAKPTGLDLITTLLLVGGLLSGAVFGWIRARTTHVWYDDGKLMRQGNALTIVLWIVGLAIHLVLEELDGHLNSASATIASSSLLLYMAISLGVQRYVTLQRARVIRQEHHAKTAAAKS